MIKTEYPYNNNSNLIRTYSDEGKKIIQVETGKVFDDAVDLYPCKYTYIEEVPEDEQVDYSDES